jgi:hypothetical protein
MGNHPFLNALAHSNQVKIFLRVSRNEFYVISITCASSANTIIDCSGDACNAVLAVSRKLLCYITILFACEA